MMKEKYLLKVGLIGAAVALLLVSYATFLVPKQNPSPNHSSFESFLQIIKTFPARELFFTECIYNSSGKDDSWHIDNCPTRQEIDLKVTKINFFLYAILGFLVGAIIGWITQRFKKNNMNNGQKGFALLTTIFIVTAVLVIGTGTAYIYRIIHLANREVSLCCYMPETEERGEKYPSDWATFSDDRFGFSFRYPQAWKKPNWGYQGNDAAYGTFMNGSLSQYDVGFNFRVETYLDPDTGRVLTFDEVAADDPKSPFIVLSKQEVIVGGRKAVRTEYKFKDVESGKITQILVPIDNERILKISSATDTIGVETFYGVINSFKFTRLEVGEFSGYYTNVTQNFWDESKVCDSFVVLSGNQQLISYFKDMVNQGNTINSINTDGNLVIHLNLNGLDQQRVAEIKNSTKSHPITLRMQKNTPKAGEAPNCFSFFTILQQSNAGHLSDDGFSLTIGESYITAKARLAAAGWISYIPNNTQNPFESGSTEYPEIGRCGNGIDAICNVNFKKGGQTRHLNVQSRNGVWIVIGSE